MDGFKERNGKQRANVQLSPPIKQSGDSTPVKTFYVSEYILNLNKK